MPSLYVNETGTPTAPSIIFIHGIGVAGWMWKQQIASFPDFHCLTVDLPGHGKSNQVPWRSLADTAIQIAQIIQTRATGGRAHVVGLSLGGHIGLALLEHHANVLDHVVISGVTDEPMPNQIWLKPQNWLMSFLLKQRWFMNSLAKSMGLPSDMKADLAEGLRDLSTQAYRDIWKEAVNFRVPPTIFRQVHTRTLIVAGGSETDIIKRTVSSIPRLMPNAEGRFAPAVGHGWNMQDPDLFSAMVRAWITDAPLPATLQPAHNSPIT